LPSGRDQMTRRELASLGPTEPDRSFRPDWRQNVERREGCSQKRTLLEQRVNEDNPGGEIYRGRPGATDFVEPAVVAKGGVCPSSYTRKRRKTGQENRTCGKLGGVRVPGFIQDQGSIEGGGPSSRENYPSEQRIIECFFRPQTKK